MNIRFTHSAFASDWGTESNVTTQHILSVIGYLENYELALLGYDYENGCAIPDASEIEDADAIVSVVAMLKREVQKRERARIARHVWKEAEAKGWKRSMPQHKQHIETIIDDIASDIASEDAQ